MLVTKDADFEEMSALYGPPPKVVWTRVGNQPTQTVLDLLITNAEVIGEFAQSSADAFADSASAEHRTPMTPANRASAVRNQRQPMPPSRARQLDLSN
jgi:hypothetical protein